MSALTTKIPIRDARGNLVDEREVATYAGLLARAHEEGLCDITTSIIELPSEKNAMTAICFAKITTSKGTFTGIGDANAENVNRRIAPHILRMAETRAKARALRDAVNIGVVALEELGGNDEVDDLQPQSAAPIRSVAERREPARVVPMTPKAATKVPEQPMTEAQRRYLFRILSERGHDPREIGPMLCADAGVANLTQISKSTASALIDRWTKETSGGGHGA